MNERWPIVISGDSIFLRPLRFRDRSQWNALRAENRTWLEPWEATIPILNSDGEHQQLPSYFTMVQTLNREARHGRSFSFAIWHNHNLVGQISLGGVIYGALRGGHIGYWITAELAGRGFIPIAVNLVSEYAFKELGLHRLEISMRPENVASKQVALKCGFEFESLRKRFLHIDGDWRDHHTYVKLH